MRTKAKAKDRYRPRPNIRYKRVGALVRKIREAEGLNQEAAAKKLEVNTGQLSLFERGMKAMTPEELLRFCKVFKPPLTVRGELRAAYREGTGGTVDIPGLTEDPTLPVRPHLEPFRFGPLRTQFLAVDNIEAGGILPENITLTLDETPLEIPASLYPFYKLYLQDYEQRKKRGDSRLPYDGDTLTIRDISLTRAPKSEHPVLHLILQKSTFFQHMALIQNLDALYTDAGQRKTMRAEFLEAKGYDPCHPPSLLSSLSVTSAVHLTKEDRLLLVKRAKTEVYPNAFSAGSGEWMRPDDLTNAPGGQDLLNCAVRGLKEELHVVVPPDAITLLSLGIDQHEGRYGAPALISIKDLSLAELSEEALRARDVKLETEVISSIPARPLKEALTELFTHTQRSNTLWPPFPIATVLLALRFLNPKRYEEYDTLLRQNPAAFGFAPPSHLLVPHLPPLARHTL